MPIDVKISLTVDIQFYKNQSHTETYHAPFVTETATEEEMRKRCRELGKGEEYADFCVDAFVKKIRRKAQAEKIGVEENTVKYYRNIRRKELEDN